MKMRSTEVSVFVSKTIEKNFTDKIKIEEIQDLIEQSLEKKGYKEVHDSFAEYRERRAQSREMFIDDKRMHKFLKTIEGLGLKSASEDDTKRENANVDGDTAMGTMLQYGSTVSKEFAKSYLMKKKFADAHDNGDIHIHDMDFLPMGTTTCMQIELDRLFKKGFSTGHGYLRPPKDIASFSALAAIAVCDHLGIAKTCICAGLQNFQGVQRRFEYLHKTKGERCGVRLALLIHKKQYLQ